MIYCYCCFPSCETNDYPTDNIASSSSCSSKAYELSSLEMTNAGLFMSLKRFAKYTRCSIVLVGVKASRCDR